MSNNMIDLTANVHAIGKSNIATGTRSGYYNRLIGFTVICFDSRELSGLIQTHFMEHLIAAHNRDKTEPRYRNSDNAMPYCRLTHSDFATFRKTR